MIRKEPERGGGRRPLLATFVGNNRQMLNEIRDSLSHLRKSQTEADSEMPPSNMHLRTEMSQSTPNLADKSTITSSASSAGTPSGAKRGLEYHHKTLAEIRDSLRPFQTGNRTQSGEDVDISRNKIQQVMMTVGVDEVGHFECINCCVNILHTLDC